MIDSFHIGAYWGSRAEPLKQVRDKALKTLHGLATIDEQFSDWYEGANSRKKALEKKVSVDAATIEWLCLQKVKKGELDENGFAKMGFLFGLWTGHDDDQSSSISFIAGGAFSSPHLCNACVINLPYDGAARERLLQTEKAKKIIALLVDIWTPDYSVLASSFLNSRLNTINDIGWITYRQSIKKIPEISAKVIHEKANNGHWFYIRENDYSDSSANELLPLKLIF